ncbi:MAG: T9SS type A sorting domain-containing protein, partial [Candidatus Marinimicrobia bacterium]|nr:T9SS type A sorting domain-containing protein [Candidatus Neomarinimicrobiota bacterium]
TPPTALAGIGDYETESYPNLSPREVIEGCGDFQNYSVYTSDGTVVATIDTNYYIHENLTVGTEYCYYVVANYSEGASSATATLCATPETFLPDGVTNLSGIGLHEEVVLSWTDPEVLQLGVPYEEGFDESILLDLWSIEGVNWSWYELAGNPMPCMRFSWTPTALDYDQSLYSPVIPLGTLTDVTVSFDWEFNNFSASGLEFFAIEYRTGTDPAWNVLEEFANTGDNFLFTNFSYDVAGLTDNIQVRFHCYGATTFDINWYYIDNFSVTSDTRAISDEAGSSTGRDMTGSTVSTNDTYIPGNTHTMEFSVNILSPDISSRDTTDGDLLGYNVYVDDDTSPINLSIIEQTSYIVTGLTNDQSYTFGVTAVYYPAYESNPMEVTVTPTWLYGDVSGTVSDPNGNLLDSAIVRVGNNIDTTGADGTYFLDNLEPGVHTVSVQRQDFENDSEEVTVIAQAAAVVQDFVLTPSLARAGGLEATAGDHQIDLIWSKPGASGSYELYYYDDIFEAQIGCGGGCEFGVRYTPLGYPATLTTLLVSVQGDAGVISGNIIAFIDESGSGLGPDGLTSVTLASGLDLSSPDGSLTQYEVDVSEAGLVANSGDVYVMIQENNAGFMGIANDIEPQSPEYYDRNWVMTGGLYQTIFDAVGGDPSLTGDFGVLATFDGASLAAATLNSSNQVVEQVPTAIHDGTFKTGVDAAYDIESNRYQRTPNPDNVVRLMNIHIPEPAARSRTDSLIGYNIYQALDDGDTLVTTNTGADDTTATITVPDNYVEYCYNVRARWSTDNYGVLESKPTGDVCAVPYRAGDIDFNDAVDVSDLLSVVDYVLEVSIPTEDQFRGADVNQDTAITINDVVLIVDIIYGTAARTMASADATALADLLSADQQLLISLDYDGLTRGIQFELDADAALEFGTPLLAVNDAGTMVSSHRTEAGKITVVVVNTTGGTVERYEDILVRLPYTFKGNRRDKAVVELTDLQAAGMAGESLPVTIGEKRIDISVIPSVFALHQNYPNPFNPVTEIQFDVPVESQVTLTIYNIMGQEVTTLTNSTLKAGFHNVRWDGTNGYGELVSTGVYFYRLSSPAFTSTKKMIMVK